MKLIDLKPRFYCHGGEGITDKDGNPIPLREKLGLVCECPCGTKMGELQVPCMISLAFANPPDGGPPLDADAGRPAWTRTGEAFETMSLTPSILNKRCGWHGYFTNGEVITV